MPSISSILEEHGSTLPGKLTPVLSTVATQAVTAVLPRGLENALAPLVQRLHRLEQQGALAALRLKSTNPFTLCARAMAELSPSRADFILAMAERACQECWELHEFEAYWLERSETPELKATFSRMWAQALLASSNSNARGIPHDEGMGPAGVNAWLSKKNQQQALIIIYMGNI